MLSIHASDKLVVVTLDSDWAPVYFKQISPGLRMQVDVIQGEAQMMSGRAHWHGNSAALAPLKSAKDGALPHLRR